MGSPIRDLLVLSVVSFWRKCAMRVYHLPLTGSYCTDKLDGPASWTALVQLYGLLYSIVRNRLHVLVVTGRSLSAVLSAISG